VISGSTKHQLRVWNANTGTPLLRMDPAGQVGSDGVEVTVASTDSSGFRVATGAQDGAVVVWDVGSGQRLKERRPRRPGQVGNGDHRVVGMAYCELEGRRCIVVVEASNSILLLSVIVIHRCISLIENLHSPRNGDRNHQGSENDFYW